MAAACVMHGSMNTPQRNAKQATITEQTNARIERWLAKRAAAGTRLSRNAAIAILLDEALTAAGVPAETEVNAGVH